MVATATATKQCAQCAEMEMATGGKQQGPLCYWCRKMQADLAAVALYHRQQAEAMDQYRAAAAAREEADASLVAAVNVAVVPFASWREVIERFGEVREVERAAFDAAYAASRAADRAYIAALKRREIWQPEPLFPAAQRWSEDDSLEVLEDFGRWPTSEEIAAYEQAERKRAQYGTLFDWGQGEYGTQRPGDACMCCSLGICIRETLWLDPAADPLVRIAIHMAAEEVDRAWRKERFGIENDTPAAYGVCNEDEDGEEDGR